jgi:hypothetical protein
MKSDKEKDCEKNFMSMNNLPWAGYTQTVYEFLILPFGRVFAVSAGGIAEGGVMR